MKVKFTYTVDGKKVSEAEYLKSMKAKGKLEGAPYVSRAWEKPMPCERLGVEPEHVKFEKMIDAEQGLGNIDYDSHGRPLFTSREQRNAYVRAKGYFDRNAGYGDVAPLNY